MFEDQDSDCASDAEVRSAISSLGNERVRLVAWARVLLFTYRDFCEYREAQDLYMEAVLRTLQRDRRWKPQNCTFVEHLMGAMRSIANHLPEKYGKDARNIPIRATDLVYSSGEDDEQRVNPLENVAGTAPTPEEELVAKQATERIEFLFEDDAEASLVLMLFGEGKKEPEIAFELGLTRSQVHAAIERVRYKLSKAAH